MTMEEQTDSQNSGTQHTRWLAIVGSILVPINILGFVITFSGTKGSNDDLGFLPTPAISLRIVLFSFVFISLITSAFRIMEYRLILTTTLTILTSMIEGVYGLVLIVVHYKDLKASSSMKGTAAAVVIINFVLSIMVAIFFIMDAYISRKHKGSGIPYIFKQWFINMYIFYVWVMIGGLLFWALEGQPLYIGVYFSFVTAATVGYGDYVPTSSASRTVFMVWTMVALVLLASYLIYSNRIGTVFIEIAREKRIKRMLRQKEKVLAMSEEEKDIFLRQWKKRRHLGFGYFTEKLKTYKIANTRSQPWEFSSFEAQMDKYTHSVDKKVSSLRRREAEVTFKTFILIVLIVISFWTMSAYFYSVFEHDTDNYFLYFWVYFITFTTIGYGDTTLSSKASIFFLCTTGMFSLTTVGALIATMTESFQRFLCNRVLPRRLYDDTYTA